MYEKRKWFGQRDRAKILKNYLKQPHQNVNRTNEVPGQHSHFNPTTIMASNILHKNRFFCDVAFSRKKDTIFRKVNLKHLYTEIKTVDPRQMLSSTMMS